MPKTGLVYHEDYLKHDPGWGHPESPERLRRTVQVLAETKLIAKPNIVILEPRPASDEDLALVHTHEYIDMIKSLSTSGGAITVDTPVPRGTYEIARLSVGGAILAGEAVVKGDLDNAFALIRPPGHHSGRNYGGGFCYFNNIAIMVEYLRKKYQLKRFMILDWDVHHGNGTQDIFYEDPTVLYFSTHQMPLYPGTGYLNESGDGEGKGYNVDLPLPPGTSGANYAYILDELFIPIAEAFRPEIIAVSAGQDAYFNDPIANLNFTVHTYADITRKVMDVAQNVCNGRIAMVLEGGYHLEAVPRAIAGIIATLAEIQDYEIIEPRKPPPQTLSSEVRSRVEKIKTILAEYWDIFSKPSPA